MSDFECYCEPQYADETWNWWTTEIRRSKVDRKCCECKDIIQVGEKYERMIGVLDGRMDVFITCLFCSDEYARISDQGDWIIAKGELACAIAAELRGNL